MAHSLVLHYIFLRADLSFRIAHASNKVLLPSAMQALSYILPTFSLKHRVEVNKKEKLE